MKPWDVFFPLVLLEAPGCPNPTAEQYLRMSARDFCKRSGAWREKLAPITTDGITSQYSIALDPAWQGQLVRITGATLGGKLLDVRSNAVRTWRRGCAPDCCGTLIDNADGTYTVDRLPIAGQPLLVQVALMPTGGASECSDVLGTDYLQAIADGALGRILALANSPFSSPARAIDCRAAFERQLHSAANAEFLRADPQERRTRKSPI